MARQRTHGPRGWTVNTLVAFWPPITGHANYRNLVTIIRLHTESGCVIVTESAREQAMNNQTDPKLQAAIEYRKAELIKLATAILTHAESIDPTSPDLYWGHAGDMGRAIELLRQATEVCK